MASPAAEHVGFSRDMQGLVSYGFRPLKLRLNSCGTRAELLQGMCCPHRSRIEPMSPKLTDRFFTPEPPGERPGQHFKISKWAPFTRIWALFTVCLCTGSWGKWVQAHSPLRAVFQIAMDWRSYGLKPCWFSKVNILVAPLPSAGLKSWGAWFKMFKPFAF